MTKDSCDVGNCKNGNKVCYNQLFQNKAKKREKHEEALTQEAKRLLELIDVQPTTANINRRIRLTCLHPCCHPIQIM